MDIAKGLGDIPMCPTCPPNTFLVYHLFDQEDYCITCGYTKPHAHAITVRTWFHLNRAALWEQQIGVAVEFDTLANAVVEGDEAGAYAVLEWLFADRPYRYSQLQERHRHQSYRGITR